LAKEHEFSYFFPSADFYRGFATVEEAYEYIKTAQTKFASSSGKSLAKGLAAKLMGPPVSLEEPVIVACYIGATTVDSGVDFSKAEKSIEDVLKHVPSAELVFLIFYQDRGVSIPSFYLASGYRYLSGNSQIRRFAFNKTIYDAEYPAGWRTEQAFNYLRKELN
jgi:hypothetical protein